jgi:hypothetical protein
LSVPLVTTRQRRSHGAQGRLRSGFTLAATVLGFL